MKVNLARVLRMAAQAVLGCAVVSILLTALLWGKLAIAVWVGLGLGGVFAVFVAAYLNDLSWLIRLLGSVRSPNWWLKESEWDRGRRARGYCCSLRDLERFDHWWKGYNALVITLHMGVVLAFRILWDWADLQESAVLEDVVLTYFGLFTVVVALRIFHLFYLGKRLDAWVHELERDGHL